MDGNVDAINQISQTSSMELGRTPKKEKEPEPKPVETEESPIVDIKKVHEANIESLKSSVENKIETYDQAQKALEDVANQALKDKEKIEALYSVNQKDVIQLLS